MQFTRGHGSAFVRFEVCVPFIGQRKAVAAVVPPFATALQICSALAGD